MVILEKITFSDLQQEVNAKCAQSDDEIGSETYQSPSEEYDSDADPPYGICEVTRCKSCPLKSCLWKN